MNSSSPSVFESPDVNRDGKYEDNLECVWTIFAPENYVLSISFTQFTVDTKSIACGDYVEVNTVFQFVCLCHRLCYIT